LISFAGLQKEIVLSSSVNMIEIWDKERYESSVAETLKDFGNLAEEVMGSQPLDGSDGIS
jgi:MraZ protein